MKSFKEKRNVCIREESSLDDLFRKYSPRIYAFALYTCRSADMAEDLTQEIFIKFWESSQHTTIVSQESFLYTIAKRTTIDYLRRSIANDLMQSLSDNEDADYWQPADSGEDELKQKLEVEHKLSLIENMVEKMPPKRRAIFRLRWEKGLSINEIATTLGLSLSTIHIQLHKAMDFLKKNAEIPTIDLMLLLFFWKVIQ